MLTISGFLHFREICLPRKCSSALSVHHCVVAENKKLNINAKKKISKLSGFLTFLGLFVCSPVAAPVGLVLQQDSRGMEEEKSRRLGRAVLSG